MSSIYQLDERRLRERDLDRERFVTPYDEREEVERLDISIYELTLDELRDAHYLRERLDRDTSGIDDIVYDSVRRRHDASGSIVLKENALIAAARLGYISKVYLLIKAGADLDKTDDHEFSALYWAVFNRHTEVARMLLTAGASTFTNTVPEYFYDKKHTLLTLAVSSTYASNLPYDVWGMVYMLLKHNLDVNGQDSWKQTPLHYAKNGQDEALMVLLLDHGAAVNIQDFEGNTPLNALMKKRREFFPTEQTSFKEFIDGQVTLAALLLEKGADPLIEDFDGVSAVTWANDYCGGLMPVLVDPYRVDEHLRSVVPLIDNSYERQVLGDTLRKCVPPRATGRTALRF